MILADLRDKVPPNSLPRLEEGAYQMLWYSGFWDGPISGMLSFQGQDHWFEMVQENEVFARDQWYRRYVVLKLTPEQLTKERQVHADFRRYVGKHTDYVSDRQTPEESQSKDQAHLFYEEHGEYCRSQPFEQAEAIAWFER